MNDGDPILGRVIARADQVRHVVRHRDNRIAARHDAIVEILQPAFFGIFGVVGRHERDMVLSRSVKGAPGGSAAPRVNDRDLFTADDVGELPRILRQNEWVLGGKRHIDMLGTGGQDLIDELDHLPTRQVHDVRS